MNGDSDTGQVPDVAVLAAAIADPGSILPRSYDGGIETVSSWAARAVRALLSPYAV